MNAVIGPHAPLALDLNGPGSFWHWNIFYISIANLALIGVTVIIFGAALLIPFPGRREREPRRRQRARVRVGPRDGRGGG